MAVRDEETLHHRLEAIDARLLSIDDRLFVLTDAILDHQAFHVKQQRSETLKLSGIAGIVSAIIAALSHFFGNKV